MSVSSGFLVLPTDTPADLLPLLTSQPLSMAAPWEEVEEAVLEPEGHRCRHGLQVVLGWASEGGKEQVLVRSICYQAALGIRSANSLPLLSRLSLAVSLAGPDIDLLQGAPEEQGGEPGNQEAWVPMSTLPPGPQDPS